MVKEKINELLSEIDKIKDLEELKQLKAKYTTKSSFFNDLKEKIKSSENKAEIGEQIKSYSISITTIFEKKKNELENSFILIERENPINEKSVNIEKKKGTIHPLTNMTFKVQDFFDKQNYHYAHGIEVEIEKYNFDILNLPKNHPARAMQDTFYLEEKNKVLRTHATNITARELEKTNLLNFKSYSIGPVFRNDDNDATHSFQFNQIDIFNISDNISIANLKWTLSELMKEIFDSKTTTKFRPSYFPFTEPSFEVDIKWKDGWMEVLGSGMINNKVIENAGKNPKKMQGFAAGIGLERLVMLKYGINDIRDFYLNDLDFLRTYKEGGK